MKDASPLPTEFTRKTPGLVFILLDQSYSMADPWADGRSKKDLATRYVNECIARVIDDSSTGMAYLNRVYLNVIGYRTGVDANNMPIPIFDHLAYGWPKDLLEKGKWKEWVAPKAEGGTPMAGAFDYVADMIEEMRRADFAEIFSRSAPPVIINISDGEPDDMRTNHCADTRESAMRLMRAPTPCLAPWPPILFNVHISEYAGKEILYPVNSEDLDSYGQFLLSITTHMPTEWIRKRGHMLNPPPREGSFGLLMNASPDNLFDLLKIGTDTASGHTAPRDPGLR